MIVPRVVLGLGGAAWAAAMAVIAVLGSASALGAAAAEDDNLATRELRSQHVELTDEVQRALDDLAAQVRQNPEDAVKLAQFGWALTKVGRIEEGLAATTRAAARQPDEPKVQLYHAKALWKADQLEEAADAALRVTDSPLATAREAGEAFRVAGSLRFEQGRIKEAESLYQDGIKRDPENGALYDNLGTLLLLLQRRPEALSAFEQATRRSPNDVVLLTRVAVKLESLPRYDDAKALWRRIVELAPNDPTANARVAAHYLRDEEYDKAVVHLERVLKAQPDNAMANLQYSLALMRLQRYEDARNAARKAQQLGAAEEAAAQLEAIDFEKREGIGAPPKPPQ